eukprot:UN02670
MINDYHIVSPAIQCHNFMHIVGAPDLLISFESPDEISYKTILSKFGSF